MARRLPWFLRAPAFAARLVVDPVRVFGGALRDPARLRFAFTVALSHLRSRRHDAGVSAIAAISIVGVTIGVTALIMVLAVMEGFEVDLRDKILGSNAHLVVLSYAGQFEDYDAVARKVEDTPGVVAAAPFLYTEAMLRSDWGSTGVVLKGIDPERTGRVTDIETDLTVGPEGPLSDPAEKHAVLQHIHDPPPGFAGRSGDGAADDLPGIIIGEGLAEHLKVFVGDEVYVINPVGGGTGPMGIPVPYVRPFRVAGLFYSGMYEYDTKWTYVAMADAQAFLKVGDVATGIEARVSDIDDVERTSGMVEAALRFPFYVRHWKNLNQKLFSALKLEKIVMGLILSLIVAVAALNIVGSLILVVVTRAREIAILRAMGAAGGAVQLVFMLEGLIVGLVGAAAGTALGLLGCWGLDRYRFPLDTDVYYLDTLPVVVEPATVVTVAVAAVIIAFLATVYPARLAAEVDPVEGLRYE